jgi:hypothetical protein
MCDGVIMCAADIGLKIVLISVLLLFGISLPEMPFSLVVATDLGSDIYSATDVDSANDASDSDDDSPEAEAQAEAELDEVPDTVDDTAEADVETEAEAEVEDEVEAEVEDEVEAEVEDEVEAEVEAEVEDEVEAEVADAPDIVDVTPGPEADVEADAGAEVDVEAQVEAEADAELDDAPDTVDYTPDAVDEAEADVPGIVDAEAGAEVEVDDAPNTSVSLTNAEPVHTTDDETTTETPDALPLSMPSIDESEDELEIDDAIAEGTVLATTSIKEESANSGTDSSNSGLTTEEEDNRGDIIESLSSAAYRLDVVPLTGQGYDDVKIISNPKLTDKEKQQIIEVASNIEGLKEWSPEGGWRVVGMDFIGVTGLYPKWENVTVYLHLPNNTGNPPINCDQGWYAAVDISLDTGSVMDAGFPTKTLHECTSAVILEEPDKLINNDSYHDSDTTTAAARLQEANSAASTPTIRPSFVIAEADDVISGDIHGTAAYLTTPSYNSTIFADMDRYVALLLNQKWSTSPIQQMTQIGWLISSVEGCIDCGSGYIAENTSRLVFTDSSVFGNLEARAIPFDEWKHDDHLIAGTWCNEDGNYTIWLQYVDKVFNHNTNIPCERPDNDSKISNSIFFENWNSMDSSLWSDDLLGEVKAHSAIAFKSVGQENQNNRDISIDTWQNSTNEEQDCTGSRESTRTIAGSLISSRDAKWIELSNVPEACTMVEHNTNSRSFYLAGFFWPF